MVAVAESLGWIAGAESETNTVASEAIGEQAPPAIQVLQSVLNEFPAFKRLQIVGRGAIGWLENSINAPDTSQSDPNIQASKDLILLGLRSHNDGELQCLALLSFGWLCFSRPSTGLLIIKHGGVDLLVQAMQRHPLNRRLQYYACGTISWLASESMRIPVPVARILLDAGGVEASIAAMRLHAQDTGLLVAGFMALTSLIHRGGPSLLQPVASLGAGDAVAAAMRAHPSHAKVQLAGCLALKSMLSFPGVAEGHRHIMESGGVEVAAAALAMATSEPTLDADLAEHVSELFRLLAGDGSDPSAVTMLLNSGAVSSLLRLLESYRLPAEQAVMLRLQGFLERLFQLNLGAAAGWLLYDTDEVRAALEAAVIDHLGCVTSPPDPPLAHRTLRLVVPVIAGIARAHARSPEGRGGGLPDVVTRHARVLCAYAVASPRLLREDLRFLVERGGGGLLTLEAKRAWLACERERLERLGRQRLKVVTGRTNILGDVCETLSAAGSGEAAGLSVAFRGETAAGDGLRREWFQLVAAELADPRVNLFCSYDGGRTMQPSPSSDVQGGHTAYFELAGKVAGLALLHGETLPLRLSSPFLKRVLGHALGLEDLEGVDPEAFRGLKYVLEAEDVEALCLTFSESSDHPADVVTATDGGAVAHFDLVPGGGELAVTAENRAEYVRLKAEHRLGLLRCRAQVEAFLRGLHEAVPRESVARLSRIVSVGELDLLIAGLPNIDVDDWERHAAYLGAYESRPELRAWFWSIVRGDLDDGERARLLHFATGSAAVPAAGFAALSGVGGRACPFTLEGRPDQGPGHLPTASTCFNRLRMPVYGSREEMRDRLRTAILGVQEFHEAAMGNHEEQARLERRRREEEAAAAAAAAAPPPQAPPQAAAADDMELAEAAPAEGTPDSE
jgi:hypothetical protein